MNEKLKRGWGLEFIKPNSLYRSFDTPEKYRLPRDITTALPDQVRRIQSYWTNILAYLYSSYAKAKIRRSYLERSLEDLERSLFVKYHDRLTARKSIEYIRGMVVQDKRYKKLSKSYTLAVGRCDLLEEWIKASERIVATASREQTYREKEFSYTHGRGGQEDSRG